MDINFFLTIKYIHPHVLPYSSASLFTFFFFSSYILALSSGLMDPTIGWYQPEQFGPSKDLWLHIWETGKDLDNLNIKSDGCTQVQSPSSTHILLTYLGIPARVPSHHFRTPFLLAFAYFFLTALPQSFPSLNSVFLNFCQSVCRARCSFAAALICSSPAKLKDTSFSPSRLAALAVVLVLCSWCARLIRGDNLFAKLIIIISSELLKCGLFLVRATSAQ